MLESNGVSSVSIDNRAARASALGATYNRIARATRTTSGGAIGPVLITEEATYRDTPVVNDLGAVISRAVNRFLDDNFVAFPVALETLSQGVEELPIFAVINDNQVALRAAVMAYALSRSWTNQDIDASGTPSYRLQLIEALEEAGVIDNDQIQSLLQQVEDALTKGSLATVVNTLTSENKRLNYLSQGFQRVPLISQSLLQKVVGALKAAADLFSSQAGADVIARVFEELAEDPDYQGIRAAGQVAATAPSVPLLRIPLSSFVTRIASEEDTQYLPTLFALPMSPSMDASVATELGEELSQRVARRIFDSRGVSAPQLKYFSQAPVGCDITLADVMAAVSSYDRSMTPVRFVDIDPLTTMALALNGEHTFAYPTLIDAPAVDLWAHPLITRLLGLQAISVGQSGVTSALAGEFSRWHATLPTRTTAEKVDRSLLEIHVGTCLSIVQACVSMRRTFQDIISNHSKFAPIAYMPAARDTIFAAIYGGTTLQEASTSARAFLHKFHLDWPNIMSQIARGDGFMVMAQRPISRWAELQERAITSTANAMTNTVSTANLFSPSEVLHAAPLLSVTTSLGEGQMVVPIQIAAGPTGAPGSSPAAEIRSSDGVPIFSVAHFFSAGSGDGAKAQRTIGQMSAVSASYVVTRKPLDVTDEIANVVRYLPTSIAQMAEAMADAAVTFNGNAPTPLTIAVRFMQASRSMLRMSELGVADAAIFGMLMERTMASVDGGRVPGRSPMVETGLISGALSNRIGYSAAASINFNWRNHFGDDPYMLDTGSADAIIIHPWPSPVYHVLALMDEAPHIIGAPGLGAVAATSYVAWRPTAILDTLPQDVVAMFAGAPILSVSAPAAQDDFSTLRAHVAARGSSFDGFDDIRVTVHNDTKGSAPKEAVASQLSPSDEAEDPTTV